LLHSLNAIFDIYGDKDKNEVFTKLAVARALAEYRVKLEAAVMISSHSICLVFFDPFLFLLQIEKAALEEGQRSVWPCGRDSGES